MNHSIMTKCPPFRPEDILSVRGKPAAKKVEHRNNPSRPLEEWAYFSANTKECFFFINNRLVGWSEVKM